MTKKDEAKAKAEPKVKDQQNGVTRPGEGTKTGKVWEICESLTTKDSFPTQKEVVAAAQLKKNGALNKSTAATQYGRWCKYHGHTRKGADAE